MPPFQQGGASRLISWLNNYAAEFGSVFIFGVALKGRDKLLFIRLLELSLRDQSADWSWQSPNNSGQFVRAFVRFSDISEDLGDCHVASLLAMTAFSQCAKQQFVNSFLEMGHPDGPCEKRLIGVLLFGGQVCCPAQEGIGGHRLREPQGEAHLGDAGLGDGCAI